MTEKEKRQNRLRPEDIKISKEEHNQYLAELGLSQLPQKLSFNRVEGDLEIKVDIKEGKVTKAWVNSLLYRGFEQILQDKDPRDALVYTPRICGICSVS